MTETSEPTEVSFLDPVVQDDPFAVYRALRERCPVYHEARTETYHVLGYDEVRTVLTDPPRFSNRRRRQAGTAPAALVAHGRALAERGWSRVDTLQRTDPPVHTRYRRMLARAFTPRRVAELEPRVRSLMEGLADGIAGRGECEFVADVALPLPGIVIAEQIGLDEQRYETFRRWADAMLALPNRPDLSVAEALEQAEIELEAQHHLAALFEARRREPTGDLISVLVHANEEGEEPLAVGELQDLLHQLITGGYETTTSALTKGMWLLLRHPDQFALLREDEARLGGFIEEVLRFDSPVQGLWRSTACPVEIGGVELPEGATVMVRYGAANRDPDRFEDPDRFDIRRPDVREHVAFGLGPHYCIGAALARMEMRVAFEVLLARFPVIELAAPVPTPAHGPSTFLRSMKELRLRLA